MIDTLFMQLPKARRLNLAAQLGLRPGSYALVTLHRPSNVDAGDTLRVALEALDAVASDMPVVFPIHPRTRKNVTAFGLEHLLRRLRVLDPVGYTEMLSLTESAAVVLTDSGGLQEETTALGIPCVTLREQTERPITVVEGTNRLVSWPVSIAGMQEAVRQALAGGRREPGSCCPEGWDGHAAERIVQVLTVPA